MKKEQLVILVDEQDQVMGSANKHYAHAEGLLHRAFSIFIFRKQADKIELLIQQRARHKYHSGGLWTNTCCSHPTLNQSTALAAHIRLQQEIDLRAKLTEVGEFTYRAELDNQMIEHEYVHVFIGRYQDQDFTPNPDEIADTRWINLTELERELSAKPKQFTAWFGQALNVVKNSHHYQKLFDTPTKPIIERFSKYTREQRLLYLWEHQRLDSNDLQQLSQQDSELVNTTEHFIENAIGYFQLPLGIAPNIPIDNKYYSVPLAVEENSIIAGLSKTAKWIAKSGTVKTEMLGHLIIGQMQINQLKNPQQFAKLINANKAELLDFLNQNCLASFKNRGGGAKDISVRLLARPDQTYMAVIHIHINPCDAMGANMATLAGEALKPKITALTNETVNTCIISNLSDGNLVRAKIKLTSIDAQLAKAISEASLFAKLDPYRAATYNKGIFNAIDAILIATGNDWRAVEAGGHAYAALSGKYLPLASWQVQDNALYGELIMPLSVGIVGGMTRIHPTAALCLKMLNIQHASELARITAAIGLLQNLTALRALVTEGICLGHMRLHLQNLFVEAGANNEEQTKLQPALLKQLETENKLSVSDIKTLLARLRQ